MNRVILLLVILLGLTAVCGYAQENVLVTEQVYFRTNDSRDDVRAMRFGYGTKYSDTTDYNTEGRNLEYEELEIFGPPPGTFYVMFKRECDGGFSGECRYNNVDIRAVPDSADQQSANEPVTEFSLAYKIELSRTGAFGQEVTISFPKELDENIDSVNFHDLLNGTIFNHTFTREGGSVVIPNNFLNEMNMIVYYNADPGVSSVSNEHVAVAGVSVIPNPVVAGEDVLVKSNNSVSRIDLITARGTVVKEHVVGPSDRINDGHSISVQGLAAGAYFVVLYDRNGEKADVGKVVILK